MLKVIFTVSAALLMLSACDAHMPAKKATARGEATRSAIEATLEEAATVPAPAKAAEPQQLQPAAILPVAPKAERFDLNSEETPAQAFFMALVDQTKHNIVVHPDVSGNISLMLQDVTVEQVLELVSEVYGYS